MAFTIVKKGLEIHEVQRHCNKKMRNKYPSVTPAQMEEDTMCDSLQPLYVFILHNVALQLHYSYKLVILFGFLQED